MKNGILKRALGVALLLPMLGASTGLGQKWVRDMFKRTSYDFGMVARGTEAIHRFPIENIYEEDARIESVRSSCGCATSEYPKEILKTWDKAEIVAELDTTSFYGPKDATLTVTFDKPFRAEVQLHVHVHIRTDVEVQPGVVQFGSVTQGTSFRQKVSVYYTGGQSNWKIVQIQCANPHLQAKATRVSAAAGQTSYELSVTLSGKAPLGCIRDQVLLVTNDTNPRATRILVPVEALVTRPVDVRPSLLSDKVKVGQTLTKRLVAQAKGPFSVTKVHCADNRFECSAVKKTDKLYLIRVVFTAGATPGKVNAKILVETDLPGAKLLEVPVQIDVTR